MLSPLRNRPEDIPILALYFLNKANLESQQSKKILESSLDELKKLKWSGNIRELGFALGSNKSEVVSKAFFEALPNIKWLSDELPQEIDKPWHLKDDFLNQLEALITFDDLQKQLIARPCLGQVKISTESIPFLRDSKVNICRYTVATK